ncbi:MAG: DUF1059 domain-containing protein [Chloroflexi bacterium]|nr:DUF1059 domain-containing protein [Chloroflexota bacterium]
MVMALTCRDIGSDCDHVISGDSVMSIVGEMQEHAVSIHSYSEDVVYTDDMVTQMRGAIQQSAQAPEAST